VAQVVAHQGVIAATNTDIVAVSFGTPQWARLWLQETQAPITVLLDTERELYRAMALKRSVWRSWGVHNLAFYAAAIARGRKMHGYRGDMNQLGGNLIIDTNAIVRWLYRSKDPTDRPQPDQIISELEQL
jgi:hypothetical protein